MIKKQDFTDLRTFKAQVQNELTGNILPFHTKFGLDHEYGGFYGLIKNNGSIHKEAPKGLVHNARLLWTYAQAFRVFNNPSFLESANTAFNFLLDKFYDGQNGGYHWMLDYRGNPTDRTKMIYGQSFVIYGLSEFAQAAGSQQALSRAVDLFTRIEDKASDPEFGGYFEAGDRHWQIVSNANVDQVPSAKTMNTHLHLVEAYTNLLQVWNDDELRDRLKNLVLIFIDHIVDPHTHHFKLHFDLNWAAHSDHVSYGHDIEGSWLLVEAAEGLDDPHLLAKVKRIALQMASTTLEKAVDEDGGVFYEGTPSEVTDFTKVWWTQAEAVVGFLNAYQLCGEPRFLTAALKVWDFIQKRIIDVQNGEWLAAPQSDDYQIREKAGPWKAPYHNGRACIEIMTRLDSLMEEEN